MGNLVSRLSGLWALGMLLQPAARAEEAGAVRGDKTFLWKVTGEKGEAYLLGSIHMGKKDMYPLPREVEEAFARSKFLVLEADEGKVGQEKVQQMAQEKGMYAEGDSLSKHLSAEAKKKLEELLAKSGGTIEAVEKIKPWLLSLSLSMQAVMQLGFEPDLGIDRHFIKEAKETSKEILEVESVEFQLNLLSGLTDEQQSQWLLSTLEEMESVGKNMDRMVGSWKKGDAADLEKMMITEPVAKHPDWKTLRKKLLDDRNVGMAAKVEEYLKKEGPYFVVVGAGHLVGENGVVKLLEQKKYKVEQVERK